MNIGDSIDWREIIGPGKFLEPYSRKCPSGELYRLNPVVPAVGVVAAECPNPEHQRRLRETMKTEEW